jgi:hypothetical protein
MTKKSGEKSINKQKNPQRVDERSSIVDIDISQQVSV